MEYLKKIVRSWSVVFSRWQYVCVALIGAFVFYTLNVIISTWGNLRTFYGEYGFFKTAQFFVTLFSEFRQTILPSSFSTLVVLSILTGILLSLMVYQTRVAQQQVKNNAGLFATLGMFFGVIAPGCAACGLGLAGLFGFAAIFATLPFKGLEISVLAILILGASIAHISYRLAQPPACTLANSQKREQVKGGVNK